MGNKDKSSYKVKIKKLKNNKRYKNSVMKVKKRIYEQYNRNYIPNYIKLPKRRVGRLSYKERQRKIEKYLRKRK